MRLVKAYVFGLDDSVALIIIRVISSRFRAGNSSHWYTFEH
jgi:hypothetical protein